MYLVILRVFLFIASVNYYGAGPPFLTLYFTPKSWSNPPGLWLAVRIKAPKQLPYLKFISLITADAAGVDIIPSIGINS